MNSQRYQFNLDKVKIDPVCHIQLVRHAEEFQNRDNIFGQLYGVFYDNEAEVTNILPFPDGEKYGKEELEAMEKRNDELNSNFNLDTEKIGWYMVCYKRNFWDSLETMKYYENYMNASFFLVYDYKERQLGRNPYKAYRLKDQFATKESLRWEELQNSDIQKDNPMREIPVEVRKNQIFELLMLQNKKSLLKNFEANKSKKSSNTQEHIQQNIDEYLQTFKQRENVEKYLIDTYQKNDFGEKTAAGEKSIPFNDYCQYISQAFKLENYEEHFKRYQKDVQKLNHVFEV